MDASFDFEGIGLRSIVLSLIKCVTSFVKKNSTDCKQRNEEKIRDKYMFYSIEMFYFGNTLLPT